jgi:RNA polymerase sigma-70 factor (ECF subfamily)
VRLLGKQNGGAQNHSAVGRDLRLEAIEAAYRDQFGTFLRVALAIVGDRQRALDAVQEAFTRAIRSRRSFRGDGPIEAWLWRTVINCALRLKRERTLDELRDVVEVEPTHNGRHRDVAAALELLPPRQRLVLFLRYYADLDYRTIALVMDVETGTVSASLHKAHAALRRMLEEVPQ